MKFLTRCLVCSMLQATENEPGDMDLSGLPETAVDSEEDDDEEDIERASDPLMSRDIVRDCLEKDPMDRTDDDIGESHTLLHLLVGNVLICLSEQRLRFLAELLLLIPGSEPVQVPSKPRPLLFLTSLASH